jgi:hypothetical protein
MSYDPARCQLCGPKAKKRPRFKGDKAIGGKLRYPHKCPHGVPCIAGSMLGGKMGMNHPARGGKHYCPECVKLGRYQTRADRGEA